MSYELQKPLTDKQRADFIVEHNHRHGLKIEDTDMYLFALFPNEIMGEKEIDGQLIPYPVIDEEYETKQEQKERERISKLSLTKREVFLALYKNKNITPDMIRNNIKDNTEALIEFDYAEKYYRGNPLIDSIGIILGYSSEDLDYLFQNKELPSKE